MLLYDFLYQTTVSSCRSDIQQLIKLIINDSQNKEYIVRLQCNGEIYSEVYSALGCFVNILIGNFASYDCDLIYMNMKVVPLVN